MKRVIWVLLILLGIISWGIYQYNKVIEENNRLKGDIGTLQEKLVKVTEESDKMDTKTKEYEEKIKELVDSEKMLETRVLKLMNNSALESIVLNWYEKQEKTDEDISNILLALPEIKWKKLREISEIVNYDLIEWVNKLDVKKEEDLINIIKLSQNVDGAYAECYSNIIESIFLAKDIELMKALAKIPQYTESISGYLAYSVYETDRFNIVYNSMNGLLKSQELNEDEKGVARNFIEGFDKFIRLNFQQ